MAHCHVDYPAFPFSRLVRTLTLHTVHGRLDLPHLEPMFREFRGGPLVSIRHAQRAPLAGVQPHWVATVHHGLPLAGMEPATAPGRYLTFLGRISPEKRPDLAIEMAVRSGWPPRIAAKVDAADRVYFEQAIAPRLAHPLVTYEGEVSSVSAPAPTRNPVASSPQAWSAGLVFHLLSAMLGLAASADQNQLTMARPRLPGWLPSLELRGLRVGASRLTLRAGRGHHGAAIERLSREESADLVVRR